MQNELHKKFQSLGKLSSGNRVNGAPEPDIKSSALSLSGQEITKKSPRLPKTICRFSKGSILLWVIVKLSRNYCLSLSIKQLIILLFCLVVVKSLAAAKFHHFIFFSEPQQFNVFPIYYYRSSKLSRLYAKVFL